ncbi:kinase domain protein [Ceratobasidium sp. AG-Ba]|nr:kinase domain protein [Ceratobasidium sp. AG-Ba]
MSATSAHSTTSIADPTSYPEEDLRFDKKGRASYYPAWLGQHIQDGKYIIVRKLGWGQYSSVWLAKDREFDRFVSLKILTCEATTALKSKRSDEIELLRKLAATDRSHPGSRHAIEFYDTFEFDGLEGQHCCIVTEVLGRSVDTLRKESADSDLRLSLPLVKTIIKQVLLGLDYLHGPCGIVHAGM